MRRRAAAVSRLETIDAQIAADERRRLDIKAERARKAEAKAERAAARAAASARFRENERRRALRIRRAAEESQEKADQLRRRTADRERLEAKRSVDAPKIAAFEAGLKQVSRSASRHYERIIAGAAIIGKGKTPPVFDARRALIWLCLERLGLTARDVADCSGLKVASVRALANRPLSMDALHIVRGVLLDLAPPTQDSVADGQR